MSQREFSLRSSEEKGHFVTLIKNSYKKNQSESHFIKYAERQP